MLNKQKKDLAYYLFSGVVPSAFGFLLVPIYTRYLSPKDYGILAIFSVFVFTIRPLILMGAARKIEVEYFKLVKTKLANLIGFSVINSFVSAIALCVLFFFLGSWINEQLFQNELQNANWLILIPIVAFGFAVNSIGSIILRNNKNSIGFLGLNLGKSILEHLVSVLLITLFLFNWQGKVLGLVGSSLLSATLVFIYLVATKGIAFVSNKNKGIHYKSVLPLVVMDLTILGIESSDRIFISVMGENGTEDVGIYSIAYLIGGLVVYVINAGTNVFSPDVFRLLALKTVESKQIIVRRTFLFFILVIGVAVLISMTKSLAFDYFIGPEFYKGIEMVSIIAFSFVFQVMFLLGYNICMFKGKSKLPSRISVLAFILNIVLNYLLISQIGVKGAAISTLITNAFLGISTLFASQLLVKLPWLYFLDPNTKSKH